MAQGPWEPRPKSVVSRFADCAEYRPSLCQERPDKGQRRRTRPTDRRGGGAHGSRSKSRAKVDCNSASSLEPLYWIWKDPETALVALVLYCYHTGDEPVLRKWRTATVLVNCARTVLAMHWNKLHWYYARDALVPQMYCTNTALILRWCSYCTGASLVLREYGTGTVLILSKYQADWPYTGMHWYNPKGAVVPDWCPTGTTPAARAKKRRGGARAPYGRRSLPGQPIPRKLARPTSVGAVGSGGSAVPLA